MISGDIQEEAFRRYEREVLDVHHQTLALWRIPRAQAMFSLFAQYDCNAIVYLALPDVLPGIAPVQLFKSLDEGLSQAARWLYQGGFEGDIFPLVDRKAINDAGAFSQFAGKYVDIADFHKMHGHGQVGILVDDVTCTVRFIPRSDTSQNTPVCGMANAAHRLAKHPLLTSPDSFEQLHIRAREAISAISFHTESGRIVLNDVSIANHQGIRDILSIATPKEPLLLNAHVDLVGFTLDEFTLYFEALRRWSQCAIFAFVNAVMQRKMQQWECIPTQAIPIHSFVDIMKTLSGLSENCVRRITDRLKYDNRTFLPDIFQQPLFVGSSLVCWSALAVINSRYMRNMLKLMSRTPDLRNYAATLIGSQDTAAMRELGDLLSRRGRMQFKLHSEIEAGTRGEIDLLAYSTRYPSDILIVEGKALLGVDEINEVASATKEMQKGQRQLGKAISILSQMNTSAKERLFKFVNWNVEHVVKGVVVALDAEPNELYDHSEFPGISFESIKSRLRDNHFSSPVKFWNACRERRWLNSVRKYDKIWLPYKVGNVTYELPGLSGPPGG